MVRSALVLGAGLLIGIPSSAAQPKASHPAARSQNPGELTITGCLAKGSDGAYLLTKSRVAEPNDLSAKGGKKPKGPAPVGTTGTVSAPGAAPAPTPTEPAGSGTLDPANTWWLSGDKDLDIYVGHQIAITGRAANSPHLTGSPGMSSSARGADPTTPNRPAAMPTVEVSSVRTILSTCS